MKLRPELLEFAELMESRLRAHDTDRGDSWKVCERLDLLGGFYEELDEALVMDPDASEWADVANFALFLWWQVRGDRERGVTGIKEADE